MGEAGEVVCLEACLGGHGEGKDLNAGAKMRAADEGGAP